TPPLTVNGDCLMTQVQSVFQQTGNTKVILIGHSMGGLVIRDYLSKYGYLNQVKAFFSLGTPHAGIVKEILEKAIGKCSNKQPAVCEMASDNIQNFNS